MRKLIKFGDYEVLYDCVLNHDAYNYLRISLEVPRGTENPTTCEVLLNGFPIGTVDILRDPKLNPIYVATPLKKGKRGRKPHSHRSHNLGLAISKLLLCNKFEGIPIG